MNAKENRQPSVSVPPCQSQAQRRQMSCKLFLFFVCLFWCMVSAKAVNTCVTETGAV
ncbi:MAG: hypothetical protein ACLQVY_18865 [Limisphaerales bacterium]